PTQLHSFPTRRSSDLITDLTKPDWCLIDLDPKEAPFAHVITLAKTMWKLCVDVEMPAFVKTTGKSGLHIMLPLGRQLTYAQCLQDRKSTRLNSSHSQI